MRDPLRSRFTVAFSLLLSCAAPAGAVLPFDDTGRLYVSMWSADEIAVFTRQGEPVTRFSAEGLDGPRGLAFHPAKDELWVAGELSDALYVFDGEHRLLRTVRHADFDEPVAVTFSAPARANEPVDVYVSNSGGDEILVFSDDGELQRRFGDPSLRDPNCSALLPDGTLFVANRLGGSTRSGGAVARFGSDERFAFDFTTDGLASTMAVARDPNVVSDTEDDTLWVTSGAGTLGIHEFDLSGNLLRSILPEDVPGGDDLVPQGIAFADDGHFVVVSLNEAVFEFDGEGNHVARFPTGAGRSRSTAFRRCDAACADRSEVDPSTGATADPAAVGSGGGSGGGALAVWALVPLVVTRRMRGRALTAGVKRRT